jgi:hypothetical protein
MLIHIGIDKTVLKPLTEPGRRDIDSARRDTAPRPPTRMNSTGRDARQRRVCRLLSPA